MGKTLGEVGMDTEKRCMALRVAAPPDEKARAALARALAKVCPDWGALEVEILPGSRETLLLIHPAAGAYIDRRAAELLATRFDEPAY